MHGFKHLLKPLAPLSLTDCTDPLALKNHVSHRLILGFVGLVAEIECGVRGGYAHARANSCAREIMALIRKDIECLLQKSYPLSLSNLRSLGIPLKANDVDYEGNGNWHGFDWIDEYVGDYVRLTDFDSCIAAIKSIVDKAEKSTAADAAGVLVDSIFREGFGPQRGGIKVTVHGGLKETLCQTLDVVTGDTGFDFGLSYTRGTGLSASLESVMRITPFTHAFRLFISSEALAAIEAFIVKHGAEDTLSRYQSYMARAAA